MTKNFGTSCHPYKFERIILIKYIFYRAENISEDEKYYKTITGLDDKTGMKDSIDHGNISPRKCKNFSLKFG